MSRRSQRIKWQQTDRIYNSRNGFFHRCVGISVKWWIDDPWRIIPVGYWQRGVQPNGEPLKHPENYKRYAWAWLKMTITIYWPTKHAKGRFQNEQPCL